MATPISTSTIDLTSEHVTAFVNAVKFAQENIINQQIANLIRNYTYTDNVIKKLQQEHSYFELKHVSLVGGVLTEHTEDTEDTEKLAAIEQKIQALVNTSLQLKAIVSSLPEELAPNAVAELTAMQQKGFANLPSCITQPTIQDLAKTSSVEELQNNLKILNTDAHYQHTGVIGTILKFLETLGLKLSVKTATEKAIDKTSHSLWHSVVNKNNQKTSFDGFLNIVKIAGSSILAGATAMSSAHSPYAYAPFYVPTQRYMLGT